MSILFTSFLWGRESIRLVFFRQNPVTAYLVNSKAIVVFILHISDL